jgi:hypothetical protein
MGSGHPNLLNLLKKSNEFLGDLIPLNGPFGDQNGLFTKRTSNGNPRLIFCETIDKKLIRNLQNQLRFITPAFCLSADLTPCHIYGIPILPSCSTLASFKLHFS